MDKQINTIFKYAIILFIITAVSAALLAGINMLTKGQIEQNSKMAEQKALGKVMPDATAFEALGEEVSKMYGADAIYLAKNADGKKIGYCVKVSQNGYGGAVQSIIGVSQDAFVVGVEIISHSETPGLGANLTNDSFKGQFVGKSHVEVVKAGAKDGQVNAISGATISSKAMAMSVNAAIDITESIMKGDTVGEGEAEDE